MVNPTCEHTNAKEESRTWEVFADGTGIVRPVLAIHCRCEKCGQCFGRFDWNARQEAE